jgi:hypothetical protein
LHPNNNFRQRDSLCITSPFPFLFVAPFLCLFLHNVHVSFYLLLFPIAAHKARQGAVNAMHETSDARNPGKLPRLVFASHEQQQQQQQQQQLSAMSSEVDAEIAFPDSFLGASTLGPLFV